MPGPECKPDGKFEEVQCKSLTKQCWCVDESGSELTGSRTTKYLRCPQAGRCHECCFQVIDSAFIDPWNPLNGGAVNNLSHESLHWQC